MKLKIVIPFTLLLICNLSFGQDYKSSTESVKNIDNQIEEGAYSTDEIISADKLIIKTSENNQLDQYTMDSAFFDEKEWEEIKNQIKRNKQRISIEDEVHTSAVIDTIFVHIPIHANKPQLSGW